MRGFPIYNLLALTTCATLAAWAWQEMREPLPLLPAPVALEVADEAVANPIPEPGFRISPKNAFAQLVTRPPFSPSRRPPRAKPAPAPAAQKPEPVAHPLVTEPQVTLVGILINAGKSIAMVRKPGAEELLRLAKGEQLDGWQVEGVLPDRLVLSHGGKLLELELTETTEGKGAAEKARSTANGPRPRRQ